MQLIGGVVQNFVLPQRRLEHIFTQHHARRRLNPAMQNEIIKEELAVTNESTESKKVFVEPAISVPVDVLEATTFFQAATSGATN